MNETLRKALLAISIVFLAVVLAGVGLIMHLRYSLRQGLGFFDSDLANLIVMANLVAGTAFERYKPCLYTIDESSLGDEKSEPEMSDVGQMLARYRARFGVAAQDLTDLSRILDPEYMRQLEKECFLYVDPSGATVVGCGGARPPSSDLAELMSTAAYVQRFYKVGDTEVLYIPAMKECPGDAPTPGSGSIR